MLTARAVQAKAAEDKEGYGQGGCHGKGRLESDLSNRKKE